LAWIAITLYLTGRSFERMKRLIEKKSGGWIEA